MANGHAVQTVSVEQLVPGDVVSLLSMQAVYVQQAPHPLYNGLRLVVWKLSNGEWSHDALDSRQMVGERTVGEGTDRVAALRWALLHGQEAPF